MKRRAFIRSLAALGAMGTTSLGSFQVVAAAKGAPRLLAVVPDAFDEIDHFDIPHRVRDGLTFATPSPSIQKDVVVIGGGISGLTAMDRLEDYDAMLIEKEGELGGNSRRRKSGGAFYPLGAIVSQGPVAPFTDFFNELKVPFELVKEPRLAYHIDGRNVLEPLRDGWRGLPLPRKEREDFRRVRDDLAALLHPKDGLFFPRSDNKPEIRRLDRMSLREHLANQKYRAAVTHFLNVMLSSRLGESGDEVSAWIALYVLSGLVAPTYTLPGGHGAIAELLDARVRRKKPNAFLTGFTVTQVQNRPNGKVWVSGVSGGGEAETIEARCAVLAVPKVFAKLIVPGLRGARPNVYERFRYNAFLVAQVEMAKRIAPAFETASASSFARFTVAADWLPNNRRADGSGHLTVYVPFSGPAGRLSLFQANPKDVATRIASDLREILPASRDHIRSIRLHRWGHPMVSCAPGMDEAIEQAKQPFGSIVFAHSDSFGIAGLYSAVWTGMDASSDARLCLEEA